VSGPIIGASDAFYAANLVKDGAGTLTLSHANDPYQGNIVIEGGTLRIAAPKASGTGSIEFNGSTLGNLTITNAALPPGFEGSPIAGGLFGTQITGFHRGDVLDLPGLKLVSAPAVHYFFFLGTYYLDVRSGGYGDLVPLTYVGPEDFQAIGDGHGGTEVILDPPATALSADRAHHTSVHGAATAESVTAHHLDSFPHSDFMVMA
jgi:autotransporter-associated beta strand protein